MKTSSVHAQLPLDLPVTDHPRVSRPDLTPIRTALTALDHAADPATARRARALLDATLTGLARTRGRTSVPKAAPARTARPRQ